MREEKAASFRDVEDLVESILGDKPACFRGQSRAFWDLVPTAYRALVPLQHDPFDLDWPNHLERTTYRKFEAEARQLEKQPMVFLERLCLAQHHGVPTRLLDWTSKLEIAACFSVFGKDQEDCAIWCLNLDDFPFPQALGHPIRGAGAFLLANIEKYGAGKIPSFAQPVSDYIPVSGTGTSAAASGSPEATFIVWKPPHVHDRLGRQKCLLSWYHSFEDCDPVWNYSTHIKELEVRSGKELLCKIVISSKDRPKFREEILEKSNEYDLFPDLDGLGKWLAREHDESMADGILVK